MYLFLFVFFYCIFCIFFIYLLFHERVIIFSWNDGELQFVAGHLCSRTVTVSNFQPIKQMPGDALQMTSSLDSLTIGQELKFLKQSNSTLQFRLYNSNCSFKLFALLSLCFFNL